MLSNKPYLIRAFYNWIVDSRCTPILVINANYPKCVIPNQHVENGEIVFNIAPEAIRDLAIRYDQVEFKASFSGHVQDISVPVKAVLAIYAEENKQGMYFDYEDEDFFDEAGGEGEGTDDTTGGFGKGKPHLRIVE
ncbi:MAG TPA: ClpXP protease specificity-enhancing factor [Gammaproteobacteria bacterium]|nr:ClpXP protease specificity-enhancing factor [Gammaproteobacteria bacterium]